MIFSKLLPKKASFVVMLIAGICFVAIAVANLGLPVSDILLQLAAIAVLILILMVSALVAGLLIRVLINKMGDSESVHDDVDGEQGDKDSSEEST